MPGCWTPKFGAQRSYQCFCFQNEINYYLDNLVKKLIFLIMKINNFRGDLTDITAKKAYPSLIYVLPVHRRIPAPLLAQTGMCIGGCFLDRILVSSP